jgi:GNAT superfamily N-acetyltransferase
MRTDQMIVRDAEASEVIPLARLWFDGWQDAHAAIVPEALKRLRTLESFETRMADMIANVRVIGDLNDPAGFYALKDDELYQLYVLRAARGTGVARILISDAERELAVRNVEIAWLACAIGNDRAARFYEKSGWARNGTFVSKLETQEGVFPLEVWRYEKKLTADEDR